MSLSVLLGIEPVASCMLGQHYRGLTLPLLVVHLKIIFKPSYCKGNCLLDGVHIESVNADSYVPSTMVVPMTTFNNGI